MNGSVVALGIVTVFIGLVVLAIGSRSRGEMGIEIGSFKGSIWFLLVVFGIFVALLGTVGP
jgi:uncharacterized membrane protein YozB (DUF420 family)